MRRKELDSNEQVVGQNTFIDMPTDGDIDRESLIEAGGIGTPDSPGFDAYAAELAFMNEPVTVMVHESAHENAEPVVRPGCNGQYEWLVRGRPHTVARKFVQALCEMRLTNMRTEAMVQGLEAINRVHKRTSLRYPFSVQEDKNPKGRAWLQAQLAQA